MEPTSRHDRPAARQERPGPAWWQACRAASVLGAVLLAIAGASMQASAASPGGESWDPATAPPGAAVARGYLIAPGDQLRVLVQRMPELNVDVLVRPDGRISTPLVTDLPVSGKTPTEVAAALEAALSVSVQAPVVSLIVLQATSRTSQVRVLGQAVSPKAVPFREGMTLLDLATEAGGLSPFAAGNRAHIVRVDSGGTHQIRVRLEDLLNRGRISENRPLVAGDILVIPASWF